MTATAGPMPAVRIDTVANALVWLAWAMRAVALGELTPAQARVIRMACTATLPAPRARFSSRDFARFRRAYHTLRETLDETTI